MTSTPPAASVRVDDEAAVPAGVTPLRRFRVAVGHHTLHFTLPGYVTQHVEVDILARGRQPVIAPTLVQTGTLTVNANVEGATVSIDGHAVGATPARAENLAPGEHTVDITAEHMNPHHESITVLAGQTAAVNATLARNVGRLAVRSATTGASVIVDGTEVGGAPYTNEAATLGSHRVEVRARGFEPRTETCEVTAESPCSLSVDLTASAPRVVAPTGPVQELTIEADTANSPRFEVEVSAAGGSTLRCPEPVAAGATCRLAVPEGAATVRVSGSSTFTRTLTMPAGSARLRLEYRPWGGLDYVFPILGGVAIAMIPIAAIAGASGAIAAPVEGIWLGASAGAFLVLLFPSSLRFSTPVGSARYTVPEEPSAAGSHAAHAMRRTIVRPMFGAAPTHGGASVGMGFVF